jgi:hypothetical protein
MPYRASKSVFIEGQARFGRNDALGGWRSIFNDPGFGPRGRIAVEEARSLAIDAKAVVSVDILWFPFLIKPARRKHHSQAFLLT